MWRQWTVGDVVQILNGDAKPSSLLVENPPELAWYGFYDCISTYPLGPIV